jgi:hypothetical protein
VESRDHLELYGMDQLYDLNNDRFEMKNLIAEPAAKTKLVQMKRELDRLLRETGAAHPSR